jgi:hypothetical protein
MVWYIRDVPGRKTDVTTPDGSRSSSSTASCGPASCPRRRFVGLRDLTRLPQLPHPGTHAGGAGLLADVVVVGQPHSGTRAEAQRLEKLLQDAGIGRPTVSAS